MVNKEVQVYNVALRTRSVSVSGVGETVFLDQSGVDVMKHVGPDFTDVVNLVESGNARVPQRVGGAKTINFQRRFRGVPEHITHAEVEYGCVRIPPLSLVTFGSGSAQISFQMDTFRRTYWPKT